MLEDGDTLKISETFSSIPGGRKFSFEAFEPFLETGIVSTNLSTVKKTEVTMILLKVSHIK